MQKSSKKSSPFTVSDPLFFAGTLSIELKVYKLLQNRLNGAADFRFRRFSFAYVFIFSF